MKPKEFYYLQAHGYDVVLLSLTRAALFEKKYPRVHVFYDPSLESEIKKLNEEHPHFFASTQKIEKKPLEEHLNYAISLAEKDFQCSH